MSETFSVVVSGKLADGFELPQVKENIAGLFKLAPDKVDKLFAGKPVALKRGVDKAQAMKLRNVLARAGALAVIKADSAKVEHNQPIAAAPESVAKPAPAASNPSAEADITCPRCGHEQAHSSSCGLCKMDLSLHIQRLKRREKIHANRRLLKNQA